MNTTTKRGDADATAEQALTRIVELLRGGAYDLCYAAPEMWPSKMASIMDSVHAAAESWSGAEGIEYRAEIGAAVRKRMNNHA